MTSLRNAFLAALLGLVLGAATAGAAPDSAKRFGPFAALTFDADVLRDVKYESKTGDLYLQLLPEHKEKEVRVKLSDGYFTDYRKWETGGFELVSPAEQGRPPYGWTDYINTSATFVEYWMDGKLFLHLKRVGATAK